MSRDEPTAQRPRRLSLACDVMVGVSLVIPSVLFLTEGLSTQRNRFNAIGAAMVVLALAVWLVNRTRHSASLDIVLALLGEAMLAHFFQNLGIFLLFTGLFLAGLDGGVLALLGGSVVVLADVVLTHLISPDDAASDWVRTVLIVIMYAGGVLGGAVVRSLEGQRARMAVLNARLDEANRQLEASMATERELVLIEERTRAARELHDGLGHRLTMVSMGLDFATRMRDRDPDAAWAEVERAAETNREALGEMRLWVRALDPPRGAASDADNLDAIAEAFRGTGLSVQVEHRGWRDPLPHPVRLYVTRLVQEGLTNVLRHSDAGSVTITLQQGPEQLRVELADNGTDAVDLHEGFGLRALRERARALGGSFAARPGAAGVALEAIVPLRSTSPRRQPAGGAREA